ncbi:hypothetical protein K1719_024703 [Acacia pycnantha]|nr:hypothetical protein K1719_024703 [Acacia pycnantha]
MVNAEGCWEIQRFQGLVSTDGLQKILAVDPPGNAHGEDIMKWGEALHNRRFEEGFVMPECRSRVVDWHMKEIREASLDFGKARVSRVEAHISWVAPMEGWVKLNTDGAFKGGNNRAGCGGLIRGSNGRFLVGFAKGHA